MFNQEQNTIHPVTGCELVTKPVDRVLCHGCYFWDRDSQHCPHIDAASRHHLCYGEFWSDNKNRIWVEA